MQNFTRLYFYACSESVHTTTALFQHLMFPSFNIRCFSIKVISQAKGALCSANILGEHRCAKVPCLYYTYYTLISS